MFREGNNIFVSLKVGLWKWRRKEATRRRQMRKRIVSLFAEEEGKKAQVRRTMARMMYDPVNGAFIISEIFS